MSNTFASRQTAITKLSWSDEIVAALNTINDPEVSLTVKQEVIDELSRIRGKPPVFSALLVAASNNTPYGMIGLGVPEPTKSVRKSAISLAGWMKSKGSQSAKAFYMLMEMADVVTFDELFDAATKRSFPKGDAIFLLDWLLGFLQHYSQFVALISFYQGEQCAKQAILIRLKRAQRL